MGEQMSNPETYGDDLDMSLEEARRQMAEGGSVEIVAPPGGTVLTVVGLSEHEADGTASASNIVRHGQVTDDELETDDLLVAYG
jgi:hypothetical protein